jgi:colicin import membrane protein
MPDTHTADIAAPASALAVQHDPQLVLTQPQKFTEFFDAIAAEARALKADIATKKGRDAVASMAHKIARTKTAIDDAGKRLNEAARVQINAVDASRRKIRESLDALRDEVRAPLNAWEQAEEARQARVESVLSTMRGATIIGVDDDAETIARRLGSVQLIAIDEVEFKDLWHQANALRDNTVRELMAALEHLQRRDAERAELARLRAIEEERQAEAARVAEAAEVARLAAEREALERQQAEEAERRRQEAMAKAARDAEDRARIAAEARARAEQDERDRLHREEIARERQAREAVEAQMRREAQAREQQEAQMRADAAKAEAETARRNADREHRGNVMRAAKEALMEHAEIDEGAAKKAILAIAAGSIPAVAIQF